MVTRSKPLARTEAGERGATDIFMLMLLTTLVFFAGLAFDAGMLFNAHREATNIAATAARAGANAVSVNALYNNGIAQVDPALAGGAIQSELPPGFTLAGGPQINATQVTVVVQTQHQPKILGAFGFGTFTISGEATSRAANGAP